MYYIDLKETFWQRLGFKTEEVFKLAISLLGTANEDDIFDLMDYAEAITDTYKKLPLDQNNGQPTIKAYNDNELIYDNINGFHKYKPIEDNLRRFLDKCYEKNFNKALAVKHIKDWFGYDLSQAKKIVDKYEYEFGNSFSKIKLGEQK